MLHLAGNGKPHMPHTHAYADLHRHLKGLKTLLSILSFPKRQVMNDFELFGWRAAFWSFVRADVMLAYLNSSIPTLDPEDSVLWRQAGMHLQSHKGSLPVESLSEDGAISEDLSHTLLWIVLQIMGFLFTRYKDQNNEIAQWSQLNLLLDSWQISRANQCQPFAKIRRTSTDVDFGLPGVLFSSPTCAAMAQLYHFARLLLLLNQIDHRLFPDAHQLDSDMNILYHATAIVGIALGRPQAAVRAEMLVPLCVARSCLAVDDERRIAMDIIITTSEDTWCMPKSTLLALAERPPFRKYDRNAQR